MTKCFPVKPLLFSISTAMAGSAVAECAIDEEATTNARPVIHLSGEGTVLVPLNEPYIEPGYQALDAEDGDLTAHVFSDSSAVNVQVEGRYEITYQVADSGDMGATPAKRVVVVGSGDTGGTGNGVTDGEMASDIMLKVPEIDAFKLIAVTAEQEMVEVREITDGATFDLSLMPTHLLNIEAVSSDPSNTGSVHFTLDGPVTLDRYENSAIYTLQVESTRFNIDNNELPVGDYSLAVTPYSAPDMGGDKGLTQTVSFSVKNRELEVSSVPKLLAADFVVRNEATGDLDTLARITEGFTLDLGDVPSPLINVLAISEDATNTGSVHFALNGPTTIDRYENHAVYTMAADPASIDIVQEGLKTGDYSLLITPYADADMGGEAGIPLLVNFSVTGQANFENSTDSGPVVTDPTETVTLTAGSDSYTFYTGSGQQPGMDTAVSANDAFDNATTAQFTVVSPPQHGTVTMFDLGYFEYTPAPNYSGADSFTYQVSQDSQTATATTSITVYDPQTDSGFTAIKPSVDSKLIYVSSSEGSDTNTCLSPNVPCESIGAALEKMRSGYPDHVYLKRGDKWRNAELTGVQSGRSASEPAVVAYYGTGPRPIIETDGGDKMGAFVKDKKSHISFIGLHFHAYKNDPQHPAFTGNHADGSKVNFLGAHKNILFEDNIFDFLEITIQEWQEGRPENFALRRNIFTGSYVNTSSYSNSSRPSNMYVKGIDGLLLEENVFDYGGWNPTVKGAGANMYNHNIYLQHNSDGNRIVVRENMIVRGSSHGIQMRSGGIADNNFFAQNAVSLLIGYNLVPLAQGANACAVNNVITEGYSMHKGVEACSGPNLCTSAVWGLHFRVNGDANYQSSHNIVHSLAKADTAWTAKSTKLQLRSMPGLGADVQSSNNHSWHWESQAQGDDKNYPEPGRTLGSYYTHLVKTGLAESASPGTDNFDKFMNLVRSRGVGEWNDHLSASAINDYVRAGYGISADGECK